MFKCPKYRRNLSSGYRDGFQARSALAKKYRCCHGKSRPVQQMDSEITGNRQSDRVLYDKIVQGDPDDPTARRSRERKGGEGLLQALSNSFLFGT